MFSVDLEFDRADVAGAAAPRNSGLLLFFSDLEIVIEKSSRIFFGGDAPLADEFENEVRELQFLVLSIFDLPAVISLGVGSGVATPGKRKENKEHSTNWKRKAQAPILCDGARS